LFFDQVFLQVDAFERFQQRVEQDYDATGIALSAPRVFENRIAPGGFEEPTSRVWNVEFDRQLTDSLLLRVNYRENRASNRLVVNRVTDVAAPALVLSSTGRMTSRQFDATLRWTLADDHGDLYASFSKIRAEGDLNDFGEIYDNRRDPLVLDNQRSFQRFEVPNRLLLWGVVRLPRGIVMTPGIEWRNGFPYTVFAENYSVVGERNSADFPIFFSAGPGGDETHGSRGSAGRHRRPVLQLDESRQPTRRPLKPSQPGLRFLQKQHREHGRAAAGFRLLSGHFRMRRHAPSVRMDRSRAAKLHVRL
jgi:hypothetical protein